MKEISRRRFRSNARRGFTLIEVMVSVVIGAITTLFAAELAQMVIRQNARGEQRNDLTGRNQILGRQLRSDLQNAGVGSTGAIGVASGDAALDALTTDTPGGGNPSIAAVTGANNVAGAAAGGRNVLDGSDVIMVVVPDSTTLVTTDDLSREATDSLSMLDAAPLANCDFVYVLDKSMPSGAGRTFLASSAGAGGLGLAINGTLPFTVAPGSDVMCARVSTYWVDDEGWLHRSDLEPGDAPVMVGRVGIPEGNVLTDIMAMGVEDMQIAYHFSSAAVFPAGPLPGADPADGWAFSDVAAFVPALDTDWFEVRRVRLNIAARSLREIGSGVEVSAAERDLSLALVEDQPAARQVPMGLAVAWIRTEETLVNLRYFDYGADVDLAVEPY
jgi:prepilin-type N-terminal cleavage/methylation domain-containing protein